MRIIWLRIKWFFQKVFRGYSDDELWNLDYTMAKWILPRLKKFKEKSCTIPYDVETVEKWDELLDEMIWSFDYIVNQDKYEDELIEKYKDDDYCDEEGYPRWVEETTKLSNRCNKGIELFGKYFRGLWR